MKILWIYHVLADESGHITTWREMYNQLKDKHELHFLFPYKKRKTGFTKNTNFVKYREIPFLGRILYLIENFFVYLNLVNKNKFDIVVLNIFSFYYPIVFIFSKHKPKFILDFRTSIYSMCNDHLTLKDKINKKLSQLGIVFANKYCFGLTFISKSLMEFLTPSKLKLKHYYLWPSGVNSELFSPTNITNNDSKEIILFFHGQITSNRGLFEVFTVLNEIKNNYKIKFRIVGTGPAKNRLKKYSEINNLEDIIEFSDEVEYIKIPTLISNSDICIMAYPFINFWEINVPLKLLEYMAMEKVILLSGLNSFKDITENSKAVTYLEKYSEEEIKTKLLYCINHLNDIKNNSVELRRIIQKRFTWKSIAIGFDKFISKD